ncbi:MAG: Gfo/Idh/MocA family oxidoreductase [Chloroherpetonaceae bacterium]|nr:Gfo/Idh/MocA family oxidoreductase [Chthonomonadaceae bacterium]MDW8209073.1 Gfo/Idh/MocA family oxidoreductase [Chloroherpetonaceae bacterium]
METIRIHALSRREFLQESALTASLLGLGWTATTAQGNPGKVEPLRIGAIGVGSQGQANLRTVLKVPGVTCVAVCDVFEPNLNAAKRIAQVPDDDAYTDYRKLLERKDIHAVIIATPLPLHAPMTIDALNAGKHVFCEKLMAYTIEDAKEMARTARRTGKVLQIGHSRRSSVSYNHAYELIHSKKVCGRITHIRAQWNRNASWRRTVPQGGRILAWQDYWKDPEHLVNWRLYKRTSQGLMAELGSHQTHVANWFLNEVPSAVCGMAGIDYWKDGREVWDNVQCIFEYPSGVKMIYQSITSNQFDGCSEEFMGDRGTLITIAGDGAKEKGLLYQEPKAETLDWAQYTAKEKGANGKEGLVLNASATKKLTTGAKIGETTLTTSAEDKTSYDLEFHNWAASIREGKPVLCDAIEGLHATVPIIKANEAMARGTRVEIPRHLYEI